MTSPQSPTMPSSARTILLIDDRSISTWILRACGANASSRPVTRSSKRAPSATIRSARFIARLASYVPRSEEHTSELQSHVNLVCRLLLEKKKTHVVAERYSGECAWTYTTVIPRSDDSRSPGPA